MLYKTFHHFLHITIMRHSLFLTLLAIIVAGGAAISFIEQLALGDAIYFAFITGLTIGYGDIAPAIAMGKALAIVLGFVGILFTGIVVAIATNSVRRAWEETHPQGQS